MTGAVLYRIDADMQSSPVAHITHPKSRDAVGARRALRVSAQQSIR